MGRSLSIPFLAVMCVITHLLPGDSTGCQEDTGSSLSHAALSARSVWQNVSRTVDEETAEAFRGPWPSKESSPVPKTDWDWSKNGQHMKPCLMSICSITSIKIQLCLTANQCGNISERGSHPRQMRLGIWKNQADEARRLLPMPILAEAQK